MPNFYAIFTENTPALDLGDGYDASIIDADGAQTINIEDGASVDLQASSGENTLNLQGWTTDYTVTGDGYGNMTFTHTTTGEEVSLAVRTIAQSLVFADGSADLQISDNENVILGDQIVTSASNKTINASLDNSVTSRDVFGKAEPGEATFSITDAEVAEGNSGIYAIKFSVYLDEAAQDEVTVDYATSDGTATAGEDYLSTSGTLTFTPGETEKTVQVDVIGDTEIEKNETFSLELSRPSGNAELDVSTATGTIKNDDTEQILVDDYAADGTTSGYLSVGDTVRGTLETNDDEDWFQVNLSSGIQYIFSLGGYEGWQDPWINIYDSGVDTIANESSVGGNLIFTPPSDGTYYVGVQDWIGEDLSPLDYQLTATVGGTDDDSGTSYVGNDHSTYPYSAVTYIESTFPNGKTYTGAGAVVGENDVLTASHVIYSPADGGAAEYIDVYPGREGLDMAFGSYDTELINYFEVDQDGDGLLYQEESEDDLAILGFDTALGNYTGWFGLDPNASSGDYNLTGYPHAYADWTGPRMTNDYGRVTEDPFHWVFNYSTIESNPGNSGGPLWHSENGNPYIAGVASTDGWAADIASHYGQLLDWIDENDSLLDGSSSTAGVAATHGAYGDTELEVIGVNSVRNTQLEGMDIAG